ncbi:MFS transporter [Mobilicoccus massiliensis]|uniref:MFS transporter n=1 Tax=Mobilicoccus massiliensis TaxID=1522310 RepID=UPI000B0135DF|nr:aromatic acid/H+ symport family MFS transporter [Mobilicoccus massiliensis]
MSSTISTARSGADVGRASFLIALLCWLTVALEGFDLVAFGAVIPTLLETGHLGMTGPDATLVATLSLVGVGIGAAAGGPVNDRFGRRVGLFVSVAVFSVFTILVPLAPSITLLAATRLVAGLGLGACMPTAITIMTETSRSDRKATSTTATMTGYHVGAVAMSLLAIVVLPDWHVLFYAGGVAGLLLLPLVWIHVPETAPMVRTDDRPGTSPRRGILELLAAHPRALLGSWLASFMGLLLVYGLNTWLPQIMRSAGYSLASSLSLLLIMNAGAIAGLALGGIVADRRGIKRSTLVWFGASAVFLALLSLRMNDQVLLHAVVFVTGLFVFSAQGLVYALVAHLFEPEVRGAAMGLASGVGRIGAIVGPFVTGMLVTAGLGHPWGFYVFAVVAVLAAGAVALMPASPRPSRR